MERSRRDAPNVRIHAHTHTHTVHPRCSPSPSSRTQTQTRTKAVSRTMIGALPWDGETAGALVAFEWSLKSAGPLDFNRRCYRGSNCRFAAPSTTNERDAWYVHNWSCRALVSPRLPCFSQAPVTRVTASTKVIDTPAVFPSRESTHRFPRHSFHTHLPCANATWASTA